jgi:hypothetical protein
MTDRPRRVRDVHSGGRPHVNRTRAFQATVVLLAAFLLPACTSGQGGGTPSGDASGTPTAAASASTPSESPAPSGGTAPDAESTVPAPAPEPPAAPSGGPGQGNAELSITVKAAAAEPEVHYTLVCVNGAADPESKHPSADAACAALKANAALLSPQVQRSDQACTEQYGGPQVAAVTGVVDGVPVEAAFARTNGCGIGAWDAAKDVLGAAGGAA